MSGKGNRKARSWVRAAVIAACAGLAANHAALADDAAATAAADPASTPATNAAGAPTAAATANAATGTSDLEEVIVHGIKRGELIMPTTVTSGSAYGLDLGVMDTPRNTTVISKTQLDSLDVANPGGFSYLTASAYSDASFGQPNVPRIRGQYADVFFNGMRDSFTLNGYGAPMSFNSTDSIDIVKGPASVQGGPGAGVGGAIDITTKMPNFNKMTTEFTLEGDTQQKRKATFDITGPLSPSVAARLSAETDDSGSYYYDMYFHQQSIFGSVIVQFSPKYSVLLTGDFVDTKYRENDGINRVNQNLIDNGTYLTGAVPADDIFGYLTEFTLPGTTTQLNPRTIIDEPYGNGAHAQHAKLQLIQTFQASDNFTVVNNTFYDYLNRYNQVEAYYADGAIGSFTIENKTDFKVKFATGFVQHDVDAGVTFRYAHVLDIQDYVTEPASVYDLSGNPASFVLPPGQLIQYFYFDGTQETFPYTGAFGHPQYGDPGRDPFFLNVSVNSNLRDGAVFLEHRMTFSPQLSVMYGLRGDVVQLDESDPLGGPGLFEGLPQKNDTAAYGLYNGNISIVYSPTEHISTYLTYNNAQYTLPTANDGAIATWGLDAATNLREDTLLEEAGVKLDLLDKSLFISTAGFSQHRAEATGVGNSQAEAHITGIETELNYQPDPHFFATASYSFLHSFFNAPDGFYNFPGYAGTFVDGSANLLSGNWLGHSFDQPGIPKHLFNALANYKHSSGFGVQANIEVTGPVYTTQPGVVDINGVNASAADNGLPTLVGPGGLVPLSIINAAGVYTPPRIPWQFTLNTAAFYTWGGHYTVKFTIYNATDQRNLLNDQQYYGNDFLTREPARSFDLVFTGKF
jgi:outer membrane receptor protein involved in Fe transport